MKNYNLYFKSLIYAPRGFKDGYDFYIHISGTLPSNKLLAVFYKIEFIRINPFRDKEISLRELIITDINLLNLFIYWVSTVFIDSLYVTGNA